MTKRKKKEQKTLIIFQMRKHYVKILLKKSKQEHFTGFNYFLDFRLYSVKILHVIKKSGFHSVNYIGTIPRFVRAKTWFFGIILCIQRAIKLFLIKLF